MNILHFINFYKNKFTCFMYKKFIGRDKYKRVLKQVQRSGKKNIFFVSCYSVLSSMKQRPEHLFNEFMRRDYDVIIFDANMKYPVKTSNNFWLVPFSYFKHLVRETGFEKIIMAISTHDSVKEIEKLMFYAVNNGDKVIYEHLDDLDLCKPIPKLEKRLRRRFNNVCKNKDILIVATAEYLMEQAKEIRGDTKNICLIKNAVNPGDFLGVTNKIVPHELEKIKKKGKPIVGYYGVICDEWFDFELMNKVVSENADFEFVLIGPIIGENCNKLRNHNNLTYIPPVLYEKIPQYATLFDIAIIPFQLNDITKSTSPVKMFEYMALQKPIVTTPLSECLLYKSCLIAKNEKEFSVMLKKALELANDKNYHKIEEQEMLMNTWSNRVDLIEKALENL